MLFIIYIYIIKATDVNYIPTIDGVIKVKLSNITGYDLYLPDGSL